MAVVYGELLGELRPSRLAQSATPGAQVVLSSISHGASAGPRWSGLTLRFVGRGTEHYTIEGRHYRVDEHQLMIAPQMLGSEVEIRRNGGFNTLGLCIFLPDPGDGTAALVDGPIVLPVSCGLGDTLKSALRRIHTPLRCDEEPARAARDARLQLGHTLGEIDRQLAVVPAVRRRTRFETVRRMNLARAYLHHVTSRTVSLDELAVAAAVSPFHLLRGFRDCFGETPAAYHRRLRLTLAREAAVNDGQTYAFVADRFGFAGGASFSHAYRRTFGTAPVRQLAARSRLTTEAAR
ncbi:MAG: AraC family transcriptional regulator [Sphingomicrobium sp.]